MAKNHSFLMAPVKRQSPNLGEFTQARDDWYVHVCHVQRDGGDN